MKKEYTIKDKVTFDNLLNAKEMQQFTQNQLHEQITKMAEYLTNDLIAMILTAADNGDFECKYRTDIMLCNKDESLKKCIEIVQKFEHIKGYKTKITRTYANGNWYYYTIYINWSGKNCATEGFENVVYSSKSNETQNN